MISARADTGATPLLFSASEITLLIVDAADHPTY